MFSLTRQNLTHALSMLLMRVPGSMIITSPTIYLPHSQPLGRGHRTCNIAMCFISRKTLSTQYYDPDAPQTNSGWPSPSTLDLPGRASVVSCSAGKANLVEFLWQRKKELSRAVISHQKKNSSSITNLNNALNSIRVRKSHLHIISMEQSWTRYSWAHEGTSQDERFDTVAEIPWSGDSSSEN